VHHHPADDFVADFVKREALLAERSQAFAR